MDYGTFQLKLKRQQYTIIGDPNLELDEHFKVVFKEPIYKAFMVLPDTKLTEYNAFDLYSQGIKIYLEFIALDENNETEMLTFVNKYGLLHGENSEVEERKNFAFNSLINAIDVIIKDGYNKINKDLINTTRDLALNTFNMSTQSIYRENIDYFAYEIKKMRLLMFLKQSFDDNNVEKMIENCHELAKLSGMNLIMEKIKNLNTENMNLFKPVVGNIISDIINPNLANANPIIIYDSDNNLYSSVNGWSCNSLLSAMYVMIYLDFSQGKKMRKCANVTCDEWFPIYANDDRKIYHNNTCAQAHASRNYRIRKRQDKKGVE